MVPVLAGAAAILVALAVLIGAVGATIRIVGPALTPQGPSRDELGRRRLSDVETQLAALKVVVDGLPSLWESERKRAEEAKTNADKAYARARAAKSAAERAAAGPEPDEDELEDDDAAQVDAFLSSGAGMQPMREDVGGAPEDDLTQRAVKAGWSPWL